MRQYLLLIAIGAILVYFFGVISYAFYLSFHGRYPLKEVFTLRKDIFIFPAKWIFLNFRRVRKYLFPAKK